MRFFIKLFATGLGAGYAPVAPGTVGTLVGILLYWGLAPLPPYLLAITIIAFVFFSIWISDRAIAQFKDKDPSQIVIDEVAGFLVAAAFWPAEFFYLALAFIFFRIFDVTKLWPASWVEKNLKGGWGVVLDDVVAGLFANASIWALHHFGLLEVVAK